MLTSFRTRCAALIVAGGLMTGLAACDATPTADAPAAAAVAAPAVAAVAAAPAPTRAPVPRPASRAAVRPAFGDLVISTASKFAGVPYAWGGTTPRGFDCSGFTRYVFAKFGKRLPHSSAAQYRAVPKVAKDQVRVGDLVFYHSSGGHVYHVGIYAGPGLVWHAPNPGKPVRVGKIWAKRWSVGRY